MKSVKPIIAVYLNGKKKIIKYMYHNSLFLVYR